MATCRPVLVDRFIQAGRHSQLCDFRGQERQEIEKMKDLQNSCRFKLLLLLACAFLLVGCQDDEKNRALEEAEQSRISLRKTEAKLARAQQEIADLEQLLETVTERRETLEAQVEALLADQGKTVAAAQEAQQGIRNLTTRTTVQGENETALQRQIGELTAIIQSQEETIAEQEATIEELLKTVGLHQQSIDGQYGGHQEHEDVNEARID
jgi:chromosome segregation ATPase